jgi:hypothetical protein
MGPRNAYKDMLDNVVSPNTCVSMNHQNQLEQMANGAMFATLCIELKIFKGDQSFFRSNWIWDLGKIGKIVTFSETVARIPSQIK